MYIDLIILTNLTLMYVKFVLQKFYFPSSLCKYKICRNTLLPAYPTGHLGVTHQSINFHFILRKLNVVYKSDEVYYTFRQGYVFLSRLGFCNKVGGFNKFVI